MLPREIATTGAHSIETLARKHLKILLIEIHSAFRSQKYVNVHLHQADCWQCHVVKVAFFFKEINENKEITYNHRRHISGHQLTVSGARGQGMASLICASVILAHHCIGTSARRQQRRVARYQFESSTASLPIHQSQQHCISVSTERCLTCGWVHITMNQLLELGAAAAIVALLCGVGESLGGRWGARAFRSRTLRRKIPTRFYLRAGPVEWLIP